jgi:peptidoglycan hydrolase-like protein with peptidoglycan-binding domain
MSIKFPDDDMYGADIAHWQRFLKSKGLYRSDINGKFDSVTQEASFEFQREQKLHEKEPVDEVVFETARSLGYEIPQPNPPGEYFDRKGRIELSTSDLGTLNRLAYLYYLWTDKKITVTSGTRTAGEQAEAMYDNWYYHRNETRYGDRDAEEEIREAYETAIKARERRSATVDAMTSVIEDQVQDDTYISPHLRGRAVDVRTRDMSSEDYEVFDSLADHFRPGMQVREEEDHDHLQFR